ncbi:MAG: M3 family oligoendopeptidase [Candidatus Promineifilaceae bacterium]|jgi:oligoendopeptidase F
MSFNEFPQSIDGLELQHWETYEPFYDDLLNRDLSNGNLLPWIDDWSQLSALIWEAGAAIYIKKSLNTADETAEQAFLDFVSDVQPKASVADQELKERFLATEPDPQNFPDLALTIRNMQNQADLFREKNVPLETELAKLGNEYDKITGAMTADWEGEEKNLSQLEVFLLKRDREVRERAWRQVMDLWLGDRERLDQLYVEMLDLRRQMAANAGLPDYRAFAFRNYDRYDYTPEDCFTFHNAIEDVVVPLAGKIYEKRRRRLGLDSMRPWDVEVDSSGAPTLEPYTGQDELIQHTLNIFQEVDPALAHHYAAMADADLMDLDTRNGKALGGYCSTLPLRRRPFIFMNGAGTHDDVQTMLHEAGHAFHVFEASELPYVWQLDSPMEFAEVASMSMELLASPYLSADFGGFYTDSEAARARIEHLESVVLFLPYMAVVDAFQHWVYTNPDLAADPANCDAAWAELWDRFMPQIDYSGLEDERVSGWHRKLHIFHVPFYYIEYGMAQIGALQVWRNSLNDQKGAVASYRNALSQGGTRSLPELFELAGAEFRFDTAMLSDLMALIETTVEELEERV